MARKIKSVDERTPLFPAFVTAERNTRWFILMYRSADGDIDGKLAPWLMTPAVKSVGIDFKAARNWKPEIRHPHALN